MTPPEANRDCLGVRYRVVRISNRTGAEHEQASLRVSSPDGEAERRQAIELARDSEAATAGAHFRVERETRDLVWSGGFTT